MYNNSEDALKCIKTLTTYILNCYHLGMTACMLYSTSNTHFVQVVHKDKRRYFFGLEYILLLYPNKVKQPN